MMQSSKLGLVSLASCVLTLGGLKSASAQKSTHSYPPDIISEFTTECTAKADKTDPATMKALCLCTINEIQNRYSFAEFRNIGISIEQGKPMPKEFEEISYNCAAKVISEKRE